MGPLLSRQLQILLDQEWLDAVNNDRKKEQIDKVSYEIFEIIMDRLEKEWFDLVRCLLPSLAVSLISSYLAQTKNLPKPDLALPSEDSTCAICDDSEGENTNAIVFCDGCNLAVHQGSQIFNGTSPIDPHCPFGQTAMVYHIFRRVSGCAGNALYPPKTQ